MNATQGRDVLQRGGEKNCQPKTNKKRRTWHGKFEKQTIKGFAYM